LVQYYTENENMVKITLEFESVDAAIVGLGKLVGAPVAAKPPRKGRDDKGQPRGAYKPRATEGAPASATPATQGENTGNSASGVPDPAKAVAVATPESTVPQSAPGDAASAIPATAGTANSTTAGAPTRTFQEIEAAFKVFFNAKGVQPARELFAKFKIARITELQPEQYAEFINAAR
jgi:hypothetical protein